MNNNQKKKQKKLRDQIKAVNDFTKLNGLQLNLQKCEILMTGRDDASDTVDVDGPVIPVNSYSVMCCSVMFCEQLHVIVLYGCASHCLDFQQYSIFGVPYLVTS